MMMMLFVMVLSVTAQKYKVRRDADGSTFQHVQAEYPDSIKNVAHVYNSGWYLRQSAGLDGLAYGMAIASGVAYSGVLNDDRKKSNLLGTIFAVTAVVSKVKAIHYKSKAGTELMLTPGAVVVRF